MSDSVFSDFASIEKRKADLCAWLHKRHPKVISDMKQLDEGSPEQAYWHFGYAAALTDVIELFSPAVEPGVTNG